MQLRTQSRVIALDPDGTPAQGWEHQMEQQF
jgi:hypothetical protein